MYAVQNKENQANVPLKLTFTKKYPITEQERAASLLTARPTLGECVRDQDERWKHLASFVAKARGIYNVCTICARMSIYVCV